MNELVKLKRRSSRNGKSFSYYLDYVDEDGKRRRMSLGHADGKKAESQRKEKEQNLRMGIVMPESMKLSEFARDSLERSGDQVTESTKEDYMANIKDFIETVGDVDFQKVTFRHGERYRQNCLDKGNRPATVAKKLRSLNTFFNLAVDRGHLEVNPIGRVKPPKIRKKDVVTYTPEECHRILKAAADNKKNTEANCELIILIAATTGMRKSEILNTTWRDIDFAEKKITVCPKENTAETWLWFVKDKDNRTLPLTEQVCTLLIEHQANQPEGYPYVFVPPTRYDHIQTLRQQDKWTLIDARKKILANFRTRFLTILKHANVKPKKFHDLRSTIITNWLYSGLKEHEIMKLAGHSKFETTHRYYLSVKDDLQKKARKASEKFGTHLARAPKKQKTERSQHA